MRHASIRRLGFPATSAWAAGRISSLFLLVATMALAGAPRAAAQAYDRSSPVGACYPVEGRGYVVSKGQRIPIGPLSPVFEGDSVQVESGAITVVDLRMGCRRRLTAPMAYELPRFRALEPQKPWSLLMRRLAEALNGPDARRSGGSVRGARAAFWPDTASFAPGVLIAFRWHGVHPEPARLRLVSGGRDTAVVDVGPWAKSAGGAPWPESVVPRAGTVRWTLLDADGERLGGGRFVVLEPAAADSQRALYLERAGREIGTEEAPLGAVLLAAADRFYLW